ncbi:MAG TPA: NADH-quinone oxidoreductase subunit C [Opitutaceae bacterium]|nr:NADH-quinone oxidoreductase subunit C [Opitutaceae bacterium]
MNPTRERLTQRFTALIGPEAFAKAEAAIIAAKLAAEAAAKLAAEKAAAAAKAAADKAAAGAATGTAPAPSAAPAAKPAPVATASAGVTPRPPAPAAVRPATATPPPPRPVVPAAPAAPLPALPLLSVEHAAKGYDLDATVASEQVVAAARLLDEDGFALDAITGVDWLAQNEMEVVYDYFHPTVALRVVVRARLPRSHPELPTLVSVYPGANWHERETHDFFGIRFSGHPNLKPFLLPEDADFHPLRKDYQP